MDQAKIFTVRELNASIRGLLETQFPFVSVAGQISNLRQPLSGHLYFTLKDEESQLKAVLFKMQQRYLTEPPVDGRQVICRGRLSVYEPRGEYQLIVDTIDFHGVGVLQREFEELKRRLAAEGLFAPERKKPLPLLPEHVTLITSPRGAAVHDFLQVARGRFPGMHIAIYPVQVQGRQAAGEIAAAIAEVNRCFADSVLVLCRGGGSLEDLWAFNEEQVARAVAGSRLPVVSAVGHETDITIADLVADLRAPTPSAAAQLVLPDARALRAQLFQLHGRLRRRMTDRLERLEQRLAHGRHRLTGLRRGLDQLQLQLAYRSTDLERAIMGLLARKSQALERAGQRLQAGNPVVRLQLQEQRLAGLHHRLLAAGKGRLDSAQQALVRAAALLDAVSPVATLARGYAIVRTQPPRAKVVTDSRQVTPGDRLEVTLHRGSLACLVENIGESRLAGVESGAEPNRSVDE